MARKKQTGKTRKKKKPGGKDPVLQAAMSYMEDWASTAEGIVELHSHSTFSDGLLTPETLVARACSRGVTVLALTDHDTMAGVPHAIAAARQVGMRIIPGVEISARYRNGSGKLGEMVHVLAYYGSCGPSADLEQELSQIREGRFTRARTMVQKLRELKMCVKWEDVLREAGPGVAPGRPHVARAMVKAGLIVDEGEAFRKYIGDDGPAFATGRELAADEAVELVMKTGGIAVLAHPWSLKNPLDVVKKLKSAGLHGIEAYKPEGRDSVFASLAEAYDLVKIGGSDFHGTGASHERDIGSVQLPMKAVYQFLKLGEQVWPAATRQILSSFAEGTLRGRRSEQEQQEQQQMEEFLDGDVQVFRDDKSCIKSLKLSSWLQDAEVSVVVAEAATLGLHHKLETGNGDKKSLVVSKHQFGTF